MVHRFLASWTVTRVMDFAKEGYVGISKAVAGFGLGVHTRRLYNLLCYGLPPGAYWITNCIVIFAPEDSVI